MIRPLVTSNTAAWRLWNLRYQVMVPQLAMYSAEYIRKNGIGVSGDKQTDRGRLNMLVAVNQTVAGLALIFNEGHPFSIPYHDDCVQIYADIQEHLRTWRDATYSGVHPDSFPPLDDLRLFEAIAVEVYATAQRLEPQKEEARSFIFERIMRLNQRRNLTAANAYLRKRSQDEDGQLTPYVSLVDQIEEYILGD